MITVNFTTEEIEFLRTIMSFMADESSWNLDKITDGDKIVDGRVLLYKKELDFNLLKRIYNKLFESLKIKGIYS